MELLCCMNSTLKNQIEKTLALAFSDFKNQNEAFEFLKDFLTPSERVTFSKRLSIAYWLSKKRSYENIKINLKVSSATISQVSSMMNKGGFKKALKKLEADEWATTWAEKIKGIL